MNIKEYISSGILEAYTLGELNDAERAEVEKNLQLYAELREELLKIEETQEALLMKLAVQPPAALKQRVMNSSAPQGKVVSMGSSINWKYATAASVAIALGLGYLAYDYRDRWKNSEVALNELIAQNRQVAQDYNRVNLRLDKIESDLKIIDNPAFTKVVLKGTANAPQALASVYWNDKTKEIFLSVQSLRELSKEKQYQLWAEIDGVMIDAGVFDANVAGLVKMKNMAKENVTVFAVTVEKRGGTFTPSVETIQVAGNVSKSKS